MASTQKIEKGELSCLKESTKTELTLPYQEAALLHGLNEYTCHADELARLDVEVGRCKMDRQKQRNEQKSKHSEQTPVAGYLAYFSAAHFL